MSQPPTPTPPADATARHRQLLDELIHLGMDVARHLHQQITAPAAAPAADPTSALAAALAATPIEAGTGERTLAFERAARVVRRSILLARHLDQAPAAQVQEASRARHQVAARQRIIREVEDVIHRQPASRSPASLATNADRESGPIEAARNELLERLESPGLEIEIEDRPVGDIIKDILRDLGLADVPGAPAWTRRSAADIEELCARAAAPRRTTRAPVPTSTQPPLAQPVPAGPPRHPAPNQRPWPPEPRRRSG